MQQANINEDGQGQLQKNSQQSSVGKQENAASVTFGEASGLHEVMNNTKLVVTVHRKNTATAMWSELCVCRQSFSCVVSPHFHPEKSPSFIHDPTRLDLHSV